MYIRKFYKTFEQFKYVLHLTTGFDEIKKIHKAIDNMCFAVAEEELAEDNYKIACRFEATSNYVNSKGDSTLHELWAKHSPKLAEQVNLLQQCTKK